MLCSYVVPQTLISSNPGYPIDEIDSRWQSTIYINQCHHGVVFFIIKKLLPFKWVSVRVLKTPCQKATNSFYKVASSAREGKYAPLIHRYWSKKLSSMWYLPAVQLISAKSSVRKKANMTSYSTSTLRMRLIQVQYVSIHDVSIHSNWPLTKGEFSLLSVGYPLTI